MQDPPHPGKQFGLCAKRKKEPQKVVGRERLVQFCLLGRALWWLVWGKGWKERCQKQEGWLQQIRQSWGIFKRMAKCPLGGMFGCWEFPDQSKRQSRLLMSPFCKLQGYVAKKCPRFPLRKISFPLWASVFTSVKQDSKAYLARYSDIKWIQLGAANLKVLYQWVNVVAAIVLMGNCVCSYLLIS